MVSGIGTDLHSKIRLDTLLRPSDRAEFEFHLADWLTSREPYTSYPIEPEVDNLRWLKVVCFHGQVQKESLCRKLASDLARHVKSKGGPNFGGNYLEIAATIIEAKR
jgi:type IV secretory pathway VirJ component